jgi:hypothetical protein
LLLSLFSANDHRQPASVNALGIKQGKQADHEDLGKYHARGDDQERVRSRDHWHRGVLLKIDASYVISWTAVTAKAVAMISFAIGNMLDVLSHLFTHHCWSSSLPHFSAFAPFVS